MFSIDLSIKHSFSVIDEEFLTFSVNFFFLKM